MEHYYLKTVLTHTTFGRALSSFLASEILRFDHHLPDFSDEFFALISAEGIAMSAAADIDKVASSNPACPNELAAFLSFHGIHAFQLYRVAHAYWLRGDRTFAVLLQNWGASLYNVDIHPAATIGCGIFVDHAMGIVIGETALIEDHVSIWHGVTLGSTFNESGDRHPKVREGAILGAHAVILGNIEIGSNSVIAAGSVVRTSVPAGMVAAGVPARIVKAASISYAAISAS